MVTPAVLAVLLLWVAPFVIVGGLSFYDSTLLTSKWIGFKNYLTVWSSAKWLTAIGNSLIYASIAVGFTVTSGLAIALSASALSRVWRSAIRIAIFLPVLSCGVIISQLWLWVFKPSGVANWTLQQVGVSPVRWLGDRVVAVPVLGLILSVAVIGSVVVAFMIVLEGVPRELREAARIDGAGTVRTWLNVDIPCISKIIGYMSFMAVVSGFAVWEIPYMMTRGGPEGATASVIYEAWDQAFIRQHYGMSAAQSVMLLGMVTVITLTAKRLARNGT